MKTFLLAIVAVALSTTTRSMTMKTATPDFLAKLDRQAEERRNAIRSSQSEYPTAGRHYYVASDGNDQNDGLSPDTPVKTLERVNALPLAAGDSVLLKRGGLWRGHIQAKVPGVTYSAYGEGPKPIVSGSPESGIGAHKWKLVDGTTNLYVFYRPLIDCGGIRFDQGARTGNKLVPPYANGFIVREGENNRPFDIKRDFPTDLSFFCKIDNELSQGHPVVVHAGNVGPLYLRCDKGNPGSVFSELEFFGRGNTIGVAADNVTIDNLHLTCCGTHSVGSGNRNGLTVRNCEIGWGGGCVQFYNPNGNVTRFGNGVEIYVACKDFTVRNCYIYQIYDAAVTNQFKGRSPVPCVHENVAFTDNLIEYCIYSIEYFLEQDNCEEQIMRNIRYSGNILRFCGFGWGAFPSRAAHIKGWEHRNISENFVIEDNIFDRSRSMLVHCGVQEARHLPLMRGNTYICLEQPGCTLGRFGERGGTFGYPSDRLPFTEDIIRTVLKDDGPVYLAPAQP